MGVELLPKWSTSGKLRHKVEVWADLSVHLSLFGELTADTSDEIFELAKEIQGARPAIVVVYADFLHTCDGAGIAALLYLRGCVDAWEGEFELTGAPPELCARLEQLGIDELVGPVQTSN